MAVLKRTRASQLAIARSTAHELFEETGAPVYTRMVRTRMIDEGTFDFSIPEYWMGAIFHCKDWVWSGEYYQIPAQPRDGERNIHDRKAEKTWAPA